MLFFLAIALGIGIVSHGRWNWPIFVVGLGFGVLGALVQLTLTVAVARRPEVTPDRRARAMSRLWVFMLMWVLFGAAIGSLAAGLDRWWIVVFGIVFGASCFAGGLRRGFKLVRSAREAGSLG
jgi:hypothetical protein